MSSQSLANKPSSQSESLTSESEDEQLGPAQVTSKPNRKTTNQFVAWTFRSNIETDLLSAEGVPVDEKTNRERTSQVRAGASRESVRADLLRPSEGGRALTIVSYKCI